jgi:hypothetical protein
MIRALAIATVLAATAHTASAGVYGSLGIGNTGFDLEDNKGTVANDSRSFRLAVGYDFMKYIGAEAGFVGYGVGLNSSQYSAKSYFVAGVVHVPISDGFWAFGRLGLTSSDLTTSDNGPEASGGGYLYGAGFEYRIAQTVLPVPHLGVWVDYTRNNTSFTNQESQTTSSSGVSMWSLGITVGM